MNETGVLTTCNFTFETRPYIFPRMENEKKKKKKKKKNRRKRFTRKSAEGRVLDPSIPLQC